MSNAKARHRTSWEGRLRRKYGLTVEAFAWLWYTQDGKCPICGGALDLDRPAKCNIDHEHRRLKKHEKPKVRGILDNYCNRRVVAQIERGGETRWRNAGTYLGWNTHKGA